MYSLCPLAVLSLCRCIKEILPDHDACGAQTEHVPALWLSLQFVLVFLDFSHL
jgi:hypothetical protein